VQKGQGLVGNSRSSKCRRRGRGLDLGSRSSKCRRGLDLGNSRASKCSRRCRFLELGNSMSSMRSCRFLEIGNSMSFKRRLRRGEGQRGSGRLLSHILWFRLRGFLSAILDIKIENERFTSKYAARLHLLKKMFSLLASYGPYTWAELFR